MLDVGHKLVLKRRGTARQTARQTARDSGSTQMCGPFCALANPQGSPWRGQQWIARSLFAGALFATSAPYLAGQSPTGASSGVPASVTAGQTPAAGTQVPQASQGTVPNKATEGDARAGTASPEPLVAPLNANLGQYAGLPVKAIQYVGVDFDKSDRLTAELTQKVGEPFDAEKVRQTTRRLFATGRYRDIGVRAQRSGDGVILIFEGVARYYVGRVEVDGIREDRLTSLVEYATKLDPGTPFSNSQINAATASVKQALAQNGYYEPAIAVQTSRDDAGQQVNVTYQVNPGPLARVGKVTITGKDPGITLEQFRKKGKLKARTRVGRETTSTALQNLRDYFQKKDRLEATVSLQKSTYDPAAKAVDYDFSVDQGPIVQVKVEGAKLSKSRLHLLVPVFEEGTVDNDLLNEGTHNIKDYLQQQGYFDAKVAVQERDQPASGTETVLYTVDKGLKHRVVDVRIEGNKYFTTELLREKLRVQKSDLYARSGRYSQGLVTSDQNSLQALYRANGFSKAKVTSTVTDSEDNLPPGAAPPKVANITVVFKIDEGEQQMFGPVTIKGADASREAMLKGLLQAQKGQPFSLITLSGDRDALLAYYLANGFDQARVDVRQTVEDRDDTRTDVSFDVTEGKQVFTGKVLESGVHYTRQQVVDNQLRVHAGEPLDQSALLETQRNLYNLALFNEVVAAVQNPAGDAEQKNVLVQITEAKRWDVTYGAGFEAQTGLPSRGLYTTQQGTTAAQQGKAGISPRVSLDVSRINFLGTQDALTFHGSYGLLEEVATISLADPHLFNSRRFSGQLSFGYSNVQDITTFASSKLQGDFRVTHKATRKDTFIYDFQYRRVAVDPNSLEISSNLIPLLSQPVRVGGPGLTWFHDTRSPSPLDAVKGQYLSVENFLASGKFGSQTDFNRTDISYANYFQFGKGRNKYVFARNTRVGFIDNFGSNPNSGVSTCAGVLLTTNASCNATPLPERLYAGGATSHRGFGINGAGPRDLQTGYPVGGSGVFINQFELRLPPPTLPIVGSSINFVVFHDMGNVFQNVSDTFTSIKNFHQPNESTCKQTYGTIGTCSFNYYSHAVGAGARYNTPVGPIRVDFSYNLNPPYYPSYPGLNASGYFLNGQSPTANRAGHFNFFFSIGQSF